MTIQCIALLSSISNARFGVKVTTLLILLFFPPVNADAVLKGTNVNGVYDCHTSGDNVTLDHISFREIASRGITSMDMMALAYCEENGIPGLALFFLLVFILD